MRKLLEAMTKFANPEQKPGEQWKGTDKGTPGNKLVGSADESVLKDLSKGQTPKTKEEELAEAFANFNEDDLGVEEKRPHRTGSRADRVGERGHKEQPRYTTVKDNVDEATAAELKVGDHVTANTSKGEKWNESADMFKAGQRAIKNIKSTEQQRKAEANKMAQAQSQIDVDKENERDRFSQEELYPSDDSHDLDEGAADVYSITSERNGRERSKSGTLAELIEYYGYTLETGKSYEHERGNSKINLNPKNIESLVQNLNNAKSNAAANGQSNERFYVDNGNMAEGKHFKTA